MGGKEGKAVLRQKTNKKITPVIVFLAFLLGTAAALAAVWRIRSSKKKKNADVSVGAADSGSAQTEEELRALVRELREENEHRIAQAPKVTAYVPRKRVSAKKIFGRAAAVAVAAALVLTGLYTAPYYSKTPVSAVQAMAKRSLGGIGQVVQEHDKEPFVILDIVPGTAQIAANGRNYDFLLGTIGSYAPGQSAVQQDLVRIFTGEGKEDFFPYAVRKSLTDSIVDGIAYQEAYGGTGQSLNPNVWTKIFDYDPEKVVRDADGNVQEPAQGTVSTGKLYASVTPWEEGRKKQGFDYALVWQDPDNKLFGNSAASVFAGKGIYTLKTAAGDYHVIFGDPVMEKSGYRLERRSEDFASYPETTGVYRVEDGKYRYMGMIKDVKDSLPTGPQAGKPAPEEPDDPGKEEPKPDDPGKEEPKPDDPGKEEPKPDDPGKEEPKPDDPGQEDSKPDVPADPGSDTPDDSGSNTPEASSAAAESLQSKPIASAQGKQSVCRADTAGGWYLLVSEGEDQTPGPNPGGGEGQTPEPNLGGGEGQTPGPNPGGGEGQTPEPNPGGGEDQTPRPNPGGGEEQTPEPNPDGGEEQTPEPNPGGGEEQTPAPNPGGGKDQTQDPDGSGSQTTNPVQQEMPPDGTYWVLEFTYAETQQEEFLYQICEVNPVLAENAIPWDSYVLEKGSSADGSKLCGEADAESTAAEQDQDIQARFVYVGANNGDYKIERARAKEYATDMTGALTQDAALQEVYVQEMQEVQEYAQMSVNAAMGMIEVQNAPVYIRCNGSNDWLREYVFHSHQGQDNASGGFTVKVITELAGKVTQQMIQEADLVYLEDEAGLFFGVDDAAKKCIDPKAKEDTDAGYADISDEAVTGLLYAAVEESKPVIVDYGITESTKYPEARYQRLAQTFLKKDLAAFYYAMGSKSGNLADNIVMNADKESAEYPNKKDNGFHYVNRNVYVVNGTPLVGEDFPQAMEGNAALAGFGEVLAAIRAENVMLSDDEKMSEDISKAMAVQYIINYSMGLVGEYKDLKILELQPTANIKSDLHRDEIEEKNSVVLYWSKEEGVNGQQTAKGQQILRSSKIIKTDVTTSSVAAFNSSYQDINADYNMIFIGLDGQRLYRKDEVGKPAFYNDPDLEGKVYHKGDHVAGSRDTKYDESDITEQKKNALLDYLEAGYPIVVENDFFKGNSAQNAEKKDINEKYIAKDTWMCDFLEKAIERMQKERGEEKRETGIGLYTIEDVHRSAMFAMQLNALRPKVSLYTGQPEGAEISDMIRTDPVPELPGITRGVFEYRISSDRAGEDKTYSGKLKKHLYFDLNYDGYYAKEEEIFEYQDETTENGGKISVDFNEINFGIVPWKFEVTDENNEFRRASMQGCFTISGSGSSKAKVRVLQVLDDPTNLQANFEELYETTTNSTLVYYLKTAEDSMKLDWEFKTVTPGDLETRLVKNENYLAKWDVVVMGFGDSNPPGSIVTDAVNKFIDAGGGILISSAGASEEKGSLGLKTGERNLGQRDRKTYGKLGLHSNAKYRYDGIESGMFEKKGGLYLDRINDGAIVRWPYRINTRAKLGSATEVSMPDYLLDIGTVKDEGQTYTTAWFTLLDAETSDGGRKVGGYSVSPRDGMNNYYVYSMGNIVYVGQSEYPYAYDTTSEKEQDGQVVKEPDSEGTDECKIFVNALLAAYSGGEHEADVSIVAGFNGMNKVESVTVPFDASFKDLKDESGSALDERRGILGETVDVYFRFTDNNIAVGKVTDCEFYYKKPDTDPNQEPELLLPEGGLNITDFERFESTLWVVENKRLVEVTDGKIVPDKVYRIKAPLAALHGDDERSSICVVIRNSYKRAGKDVEVLSMDRVFLNRAQMFLLE